MSKDFIPVYIPWVAKNQKKYVNECLDSNWLSFRGSFVKRFEEAIAEFLGVRYCVATSNGTGSLTLIYHALGLGIGDEVITPSLTYVATVSPMCHAGIVPVLVDSDANFQMDLSHLEKVLTRKTKAIVVPQLYADSPDMDYLVDFCFHNKIILIEDSAEAFGCEIDGHKVGSFGYASGISFFSNKTITMGEGGVVATNNKDFCDQIRLLNLHNNTGHFIHKGPGFNFKPTNLVCAIGLAQLEDLNEILIRKQELARYYRNTLSDKITPIVPKVDISSEWMPLFLLPESISYLRFHDAMLKEGIEVRPGFRPCHLMEGFSYQKRVALDNSEKIYKRAFNLPSWPGLTTLQLKRVVDTVNKTVESV